MDDRLKDYRWMDGIMDGWIDDGWIDRWIMRDNRSVIV